MAGLIFGTLSVVMLIKHGFDYGFVVPLQLFLDYYEQTIHVLFGWAVGVGEAVAMSMRCAVV